MDIDFAPPLHSLGLSRTFTSEIPKCYMLGSEPEVLRKEDEPQDGMYQDAVEKSEFTFSYLFFDLSPVH